MRALSIAVLAATLVAAPLAAQVERSIAPVDGENEIGAAPGITALLGGLAVAAGVILLVEDDDDDPVSP